jgi:hypothetical protein
MLVGLLLRLLFEVAFGVAFSAHCRFRQCKD